MQSMTGKSLTALLAITIAATSFTSPTEAKTKKRKLAPPVPARAWTAPSAQQPARMIEVRPGLWISSYGCITDDGYGRYLPCDITETKQ
jgi:hypothetical protein